ncbi:unnamed protein product, partial [Ectocarpus sp. 12 AP-2014]
MNDLGRKKLKIWLQKSLGNHPENDNGLIAYVEAIVGDADGPDDDLREKWTEKLDDFLAESSADFANVLLKGVCNGGNFGTVWKGAGGGGGGGGGASAGSGVDRAEGGNDARTHDDMNDASGEAPASNLEHEDVEGDAQEDYQADSWVDDGRGWEEEEDEQHQEDDENDEDDGDDDDEDGGGRSRRSRRRAREEPEEEEATKPAAAAANSKGSGANKRARVQGGRGGDRGKNQNSGTVG